MRHKVDGHQNGGSTVRRRVGLGRPSKLTPEVEERFLASIRAGNHRETAAKFAGISPATMYRWLSDDRGRYRTFFEEVERAEAEVEQSAVSSVMSHIPDDPKLALSYLAKRFPRRWASRGETPSRTPTQEGAAPEPPTFTAVVDPLAHEDYRRLSPADRWRRSNIALARGATDEQLLLRETCPPEEVPDVVRLFQRADVVVLQASLIWEAARHAFTRASLISVARRLGEKTYELGVDDASAGNPSAHSGSDDVFNRAGPLGSMLLEMTQTDVSAAADDLMSVRDGILRFVQWLGFGEVQSFAANLAAFADDIGAVEPRATGGHVDDEVADEIDNRLRAIWERS